MYEVEGQSAFLRMERDRHAKRALEAQNVRTREAGGRRVGGRERGGRRVGRREGEWVEGRWRSEEWELGGGKQ
jgi:hypothetical protein